MDIRSSDDPTRVEGSHVVALGTFDGVHQGHKAYLSAVRREASRLDARVGVFVIDGGAHFRARKVTSLDHRLELLASTGEVDTVWVLPSAVNERPLELLATLLDRVEPVLMLVSQFVQLGWPNQLGPEDFRKLCGDRGIELVRFGSRVSEGGECVDSLFTAGTLIDLIDRGHVAEAGWLLGRLFEMRGRVEHGDRRGRTIGVPTANVPIEPGFVVPQEGVYAGVTITVDGVVHPTAISLGRRSTFYEDGWQLLEAHLIDFDGDLYDSNIRVLFTEKMRDQRKFQSIHELAAQLHIDIACTRAIDPVARYRATRSWWSDADPARLVVVNGATS